VIKLKCPGCDKEIFVEVRVTPTPKGYGVDAIVLNDENTKAVKLEEVLESVLARHNGMAPLSIIVIEAYKRGLDKEYVKRMINMQLNTGKLHVENNMILR